MDMLDVIIKMFSSIVSSDTVILIIAVLTGTVYWSLCQKVKEYRQNFSRWKAEKKIKTISTRNRALKKWHNVFITLISFFPLLGMLGTVIALLRLDISAADDSVKNNFFNALTSTAWGIVFSLVFKGLNALIETDIDDFIDKSEKIIEENEDLTVPEAEKVHQ